MNAMLDLKEPEYDKEIYIAKNIFQVQDGLNDPYAMHTYSIGHVTYKGRRHESNT